MRRQFYQFKNAEYARLLPASNQRCWMLIPSDIFSKNAVIVFGIFLYSASSAIKAKVIDEQLFHVLLSEISFYSYFLATQITY